MPIARNPPDPLGRRTNRVDTGGAFGSGYHEIYSYDGRSELLTAKRYANTNSTDTASPVTGRGFTYAYDNIGNHTSYQVDANTATTYTRNNVNQYTATTNAAESFSYDDDGNMTADGTWLYDYDAENRLTARYPANHSVNKIVFSYDYMNRYVWRRGYGWNGSDWNAGTNTALERKFLYDGWNNVLVLDGLAGDAVNRAMTRGLDLSGLGGSSHAGPAVPGMHGAGGIGGLLSLSDEFASPATHYIYCMDANGNVGQVLANTNGSIASNYEYEPFGKAIVSNDPGNSGNPMQFSSKLGVNDQYYFGYRWDDWRLGRWMNRDPMGVKGGLNLYVSMKNSPMCRIDPMGRKCTYSFKTHNITDPPDYAGVPVNAGSVLAHFTADASSDCCCQSVSFIQIVKVGSVDVSSEKTEGWELDNGTGSASLYGIPFYPFVSNSTWSPRGALELQIGSMDDQPGHGGGWLDRLWWSELYYDFETCAACIKTPPLEPNGTVNSDGTRGAACIFGCVKLEFVWIKGTLGTSDRQSSYIYDSGGPSPIFMALVN